MATWGHVLLMYNNYSPEIVEVASHVFFSEPERKVSSEKNLLNSRGTRCTKVRFLVKLTLGDMSTERLHGPVTHPVGFNYCRSVITISTPEEGCVMSFSITCCTSHKCASELCCLVFYRWILLGFGLCYPYLSELFRQQCAKHMAATLPMTRPWRLWVYTPQGIPQELVIGQK